MDALQLLDYFGVFVFAISGALTAARKEMDLFGVLVLALMPAVGGGTVRDLLLGVPVFWIEDTAYLFVTIGAAGLTYLVGARLMGAQQSWLKWMDAMGLAVFCVLGTAKALALDMPVIVAITMGVISAVVGGMLRDVIANEIPLVLQKEIYATAALVGAAMYWGLSVLGIPAAQWIAIAVALSVRALGITLGWSLPRLRS